MKQYFYLLIRFLKDESTFMSQSNMQLFDFTQIAKTVDCIMDQECSGDKAAVYGEPPDSGSLHTRASNLDVSLWDVTL